MNKQAIFDKVKEHLLTQKQQSRTMMGLPGGYVEKPRCAYRGDNGRKCAIGALIPDDMYVSWMEGNSVIFLIDKYPVVQAHLGVENNSDVTFLNELQGIHDAWDPVDWEKRLQMFADDHKLEWR